MKHIDNFNFDEWLFNYFEGGLSGSEKKQLFDFMERDPSHKVDFEAWEGSYVKQSPITYPQMEQLLVETTSSRRTKILWGLGTMAVLAGAALTINSVYFGNDANSGEDGLVAESSGLSKTQSPLQRSALVRDDNPVESSASSPTEEFGSEEEANTPIPSNKQPNAKKVGNTKSPTWDNNPVEDSGLLTNDDKIESGTSTEQTIQKNEKANPTTNTDQQSAGSGNLPVGEVPSSEITGTGSNDGPNSTDGNLEREDPEEIVINEVPVEYKGLASVSVMDPSWIKFTSAPVFANPAFVGSMNCSRLTMGYRNDRPSSEGDLVSYFVSYDQYVHALRGGIGVISYFNNAYNGTVNTIYNGLIYSPKINIKERVSIEPAVQVGYTMISLDAAKLNEISNVDPSYGYDYDSALNSEGQLRDKSNYFDMSAGILVKSNKYFGGFAIDHILQNDKDATDAAFIPRRYSFQTGCTLKRYKDSDFSVSPNLQFIQQYNVSLLMWSSTFNYKGLIWGLGFASRDKMMAMVGYQRDKFRIGYTYDTQVSNIGGNAVSAHEASLRYYFNCKGKQTHNSDNYLSWAH